MAKVQEVLATVYPSMAKEEEVFQQP